MDKTPHISEFLGENCHSSGVNKYGSTIASLICVSNGFAYAYIGENLEMVIDPSELTNILYTYQPSLN